MHNSAGGTKELYFSNGGTLNLDTNKVTSEGGLTKRFADEMGMQPNLLEEFELPSIKVETGSNTGADPMTNLHMRNWMECVKSRKQPNAPVDAGYNHSIANIMCTASLRTGEKRHSMKQDRKCLPVAKSLNIDYSFRKKLHSTIL